MSNKDWGYIVQKENSTNFAVIFGPPAVGKSRGSVFRMKLPVFAVPFCDYSIQMIILPK